MKRPKISSLQFVDVFQRLFNYILLAAAIMMMVSCQVLDESADPATDPGAGGGSNQEVDLGNGSIPADAATFGAYLHNNASKTWIANQFSIEGMDMFLSCRLDDEITLFSDGTYAYDGGDDLCGADDNVRERNGTWVFDAANLTVTIDPGSEFETTARVVTLQNDLIVLESAYVSDLFGTFDIAGRYTIN